MTADDVRLLVSARDEAARIAAEATCILRKRHLACTARLSLALPALRLARREMLWAFTDAPKVEGGGD